MRRSRRRPRPLALTPSALRIIRTLRKRPLAVSDLARRTGLSQLTVRKSIAEILERGFVGTSGLGRSTGGRQPRLYALRPEALLAVGIHLMLPGALVALIGLDGTVVAARRVRADGTEDPLTIIDRLVREAERLTAPRQDSRVIGTGVALPGYADLARGISTRIARAPAWQDIPLAEILARRLRLPAVLVHDSAAMALAEHEVGEASTESHFAFLMVEEGISAGLYLDGGVYQGAFGNAGLIGHMTVEPRGRACYCGNRGCLESYASSRALVERVAESLRPSPGDAPTALDVLGRALDGAEPYRSVVDSALHYLGIAVANLTKILEVHTVVAGGYVTGLPQHRRDRLLEVTRAYLQPPLRTSLQIRYSSLDRAGAVGAAVPVIQRFLESGQRWSAE